MKIDCIARAVRYVTEILRGQVSGEFLAYDADQHMANLLSLHLTS
jgi:hypothetical protein